MNKLIEQVLALNADNIHIDANHKLLKNPESRAHFISVLTKLQTSVATAFEQSVKHELVDDGIHNLQLFKEIIDVETRCKKDFDVGNIRYNRCIKKYTLKKKRAESVQSLVVEAYSLYTQFYGLWNDQIDLMSKYSIVNKDQLAECVSILHECIAKYTEIVSLIPQGRIASALASGSDYESLNIVKRHLVSKTAFNRAKFAQIANVKLTELNHLLEIIQKIIATTNNSTTTNNPTKETIDYTGATPFEQLLHSNKPVACLPVAVHDGDTMYVNVLFPLGETDPNKKFPVTLTLRLLGYDCAEIVPKGPTRSKKNKLQEKILGTLGKWAFIHKIGYVSDTDIRKNQMVHVKFEGMDKYGRTLGTVFVGETNVNQYMVEANYAYSYQGATKDCATYVSANFDKFVAMINDGTIDQHVSIEGGNELRKLVTEYYSNKV